MYYPMYYMFDPTYVLIIIGVLISLGASAKLRSTYQQYAGVHSRCGMTGRKRPGGCSSPRESMM